MSQRPYRCVAQGCPQRFETWQAARAHIAGCLKAVEATDGEIRTRKSAGRAGVINRNGASMTIRRV